jgi:peptidyl-tRNA hydrolase
LAFTIAPRPGYAVSSVGGTCGGTLGSPSYYYTNAIFTNCTVEATFIQSSASYNTVTASAGANGSITPSGDISVPPGNTSTFTVTPNSEYVISSVTGCNGSLNGNTYTTGAITANCTIAATFTPSVYTVSASAVWIGSIPGGSISPGSTQVQSGGTTAFTVTPNSGYSISTVTGCGGSLSGDTYTTGPITGNCSVSAVFTPAGPFTITPSAGAGGTVSPSTPQSVASGGNLTFTITPDPGYYVTSVSGNCAGTIVNANNLTSYVINYIYYNCTFTATFTQTPPSIYTVTTSAPNGTVSPASALVPAGQGTTFTVTPNPGYWVYSRGGGCNTVGGGWNGYDGYSSGSATWTTGPINDNCDVSFVLAPIATPSAGAGGTISPSTPQLVPTGAVLWFTLTPNPGYSASVGGTCGGTPVVSYGVPMFRTNPITAPCTIVATFE